MVHLQQKYNKDQTEYTIYNASEKEVCNFVVDYQKERPVQEYIYLIMFLTLKFHQSLLNMIELWILL